MKRKALYILIFVVSVLIGFWGCGNMKVEKDAVKAKAQTDLSLASPKKNTVTSQPTSQTTTPKAHSEDSSRLWQIPINFNFNAAGGGWALVAGLAIAGAAVVAVFYLRSGVRHRRQERGSMTVASAIATMPSREQTALLKSIRSRMPLGKVKQSWNRLLEKHRCRIKLPPDEKDS